MLAARLALVALGLATAVPLRLHKAILPEDGPSSNSSLNSTMNCTWNSTSIDCTMTNSSKPEVHLALIVLTKDGFNNGEEWMRWVDEAKRDGLTPRLYVHADQPRWKIEPQRTMTVESAHVCRHGTRAKAACCRV